MVEEYDLQDIKTGGGLERVVFNMSQVVKGQLECGEVSQPTERSFSQRHQAVLAQVPGKQEIQCKFGLYRVTQTAYPIFSN